MLYKDQILTKKFAKTLPTKELELILKSKTNLLVIASQPSNIDIRSRDNAFLELQERQEMDVLLDLYTTNFYLFNKKYRTYKEYTPKQKNTTKPKSRRQLKIESLRNK